MAKSAVAIRKCNGHKHETIVHLSVETIFLTGLNSIPYVQMHIETQDNQKNRILKRKKIAGIINGSNGK